MKVLLLNGSPRPAGCTFTALSEVAGALNEAGVDTEIMQVGGAPVPGCRGCGVCRELTSGCVFDDDSVNEFTKKALTADGFVFGSPVHYAAASGMAASFLDRAFYSRGSAFAYKPGAVVVSCRRGGATAAIEQLTKYLTISNMPVVSSQYWPMVHGNTPDEVRKDLEGMQIMRTLGRNMAWLLGCIEAGRQAGIKPSAPEERLQTNFIR